MDFDDVDHHESGSSFAESVEAAKRDVLKGKAMPDVWAELVERYSFFGDIAREATTRGKLMGSVLSALEGITELAVKHSTTLDAGLEGGEAHDGAARLGCTAHEAQLLNLTSKMYATLYTFTPVPTASQWTSAVVELVTTGEWQECMKDLDAAASPSPPAWMRHMLNAQASTGELDEDTDAVEEDNGEVAETELRVLARRCVALGRRLHLKDNAPRAKEMAADLHQFVSNGTLNW